MYCTFSPMVPRLQPARPWRFAPASKAGKKAEWEVFMTLLTRRQTLKTAAAAIAAGSFGLAGRASAATELTAVEWGGDVVNAMKQIESQAGQGQVNWVLHQGGSGAILPKIKATWPAPNIDYVAGWEGSFNGMLKEDWLVPVTTEIRAKPRRHSAEDHRQECEEANGWRCRAPSAASISPIARTSARSKSRASRICSTRASRARSAGRARPRA